MEYIPFFNSKILNVPSGQNSGEMTVRYRDYEGYSSMILRMEHFQFRRGDVVTQVRIELIPIPLYKYFMSNCDALTAYANQPVDLIC